MDTSLWCPGDAKVGVHIGTNLGTKFGVLRTLTVFTVNESHHVPTTRSTPFVEIKDE